MRHIFLKCILAKTLMFHQKFDIAYAFTKFINFINQFTDKLLTDSIKTYQILKNEKQDWSTTIDDLLKTKKK